MRNKLTCSFLEIINYFYVACHFSNQNCLQLNITEETRNLIQMAATAYSSLVSLMNVLTRYQNPTCPVPFDQSQIQTLLDKVTSLVDFLETYYDSQTKTKTSIGSIQGLERKMSKAANAVEDIIESYFVNRVLDRDRLDLYACLTRPYDFILHSDLEKAIHEMDEIVQESLEVGVKKNKSESDHSLGSFLSLSNQCIKHAPLIQISEESGCMPKCQEDPLALTLTPMKGTGNHLKPSNDIIVEPYLGILSSSYTRLPIHLKPCFLHMATFKENTMIQVQNLINLWIVEGFLKPSKDKSLNDTALGYLNDLIDRNLIMDGGERNCTNVREKLMGITLVYMDDSLRELCLREAENEDFLCVVDEDTPNLQQRLQRARRIVFKHSKYESKVILPSTPYARSISIIGDWKSSTQLAPSCRLLRVINDIQKSVLQMDIPKLVNVRYLESFSVHGVDKWWDSLPLFWNLEIFILKGFTLGHSGWPLPSEIWDLQYLRHLWSQFHQVVLGPPGSQSMCVLNNLQTIDSVIDFFCTDEVFRRIPNLKELNVQYYIDSINYAKLLHSFNNLARLPKLEILDVCFTRLGNNIRCALSDSRKLTFPHNLVKLYLNGSEIPWEIMTIVGRLPNLEGLVLRGKAFRGNEWNSSDGEFQRLKYLSISDCPLRTWNAESRHFERLELLELNRLGLKEIPLGIGEIESLESIELYVKEVSIIISAKKILEKRRNNQRNDDSLVVKVYYNGDRSEQWTEVAKWAEAHDNCEIECGIESDDSDYEDNSDHDL